jgi:hypothetical protein
MAKCDEGYLCEICNQPVEKISESALYLQYVIGWVDPETLHTRRECHLRCQPSLAQFIEHKDFEPIELEGDFDRRLMAIEFVQARVELVTRGFQRLRELQSARKGLSLAEYPLPEAREKWR